MDLFGEPAESSPLSERSMKDTGVPGTDGMLVVVAENERDRAPARDFFTEEVSGPCASCAVFFRATKASPIERRLAEEIAEVEYARLLA